MGLEEMVRMLRNELSARQEEVDGSNVLPTSTPTVIKVKWSDQSVDSSCRLQHKPMKHRVPGTGTRWRWVQSFKTDFQRFNFSIWCWHFNYRPQSRKFAFDRRIRWVGSSGCRFLGSAAGVRHAAGSPFVNTAPSTWPARPGTSASWEPAAKAKCSTTSRGNVCQPQRLIAARCNRKARNKRIYTLPFTLNE